MPLRNLSSCHGSRLRRAAVLGVAVLSLLGVTAPASRASAAELTGDLLLDPTRLAEIAIELPADDWRALCKQTRDFSSSMARSAEDPFTYFKGSISIDGVKIDSVGIRKKGFIGSLDARWPSLKVKFSEYCEQHPIEGIDVLTLNNNKQDPSLVNQYLAYHVFNKAGVHAPRVSFARVSVNGEDLGIYSQVETLGKPFLERRFGNGTGNLYEGTVADFHPSAVHRLEAKSETSDRDRAGLIRLAELLSAEGGLATSDVEALVDVDYFLRFWAVESLVGAWDGYSNNQNNYWLYDNADNGKFYFIPWGADAAFMRGPFGFGGSGPVSVYSQSMLANRLYQADGGPERYRQTMQQILESAWNEEELLGLIDGVEKLVGDKLHDRQMLAPLAMNAVRQFIRLRREAIAKELENWPVKVAKHPRKPMYSVEVGTAKGSFATEWRDAPAGEPPEAGRAEVQLVLHGETVTFTQLGVTAHLANFPKSPFGSGPPGEGSQPATVVLTGIRESDQKKVTMTLTVDPTAFAAGDGQAIDVQGALAIGEEKGNFFMPLGTRVLDGKLLLAKAGMNAGAAVEGEFDLKIAEMRGGFMERQGESRTRGNAHE